MCAFVISAATVATAEPPRTKLECASPDSSDALIVIETDDRLELVLDDSKHGGIASVVGVKIGAGTTSRWVGFSFAKDRCSWLDGPRPVALCAATDADVLFYAGESLESRKEVGRAQRHVKVHLEQLTIDSVRPIELRRPSDDGKTPLRREQIRVNAFVGLTGASSTQAGAEMSLMSCTQPVPPGGMPPMPKVTGDAIPYFGFTLGNAEWWKGVRRVPPTPGSLLLDVARGGPAAAAGMARGDLICAFDGNPIATDEDLRKAVQAKRAGDAVVIETSHHGQAKTTTLTVGNFLVDAAHECEAGDRDACAALGDRFLEGYDVKRDLEVASVLLYRARLLKPATGVR